MRNIHLVVLLALSGACSAHASDDVVVQGRSTEPSAGGQTIMAHAAQAINDATAAAVIGGLQTRFEGQSVQFRLGNVLSERASLRSR